MVKSKKYPVIDPVETGKNIIALCRKSGLTVRELQAYFGFTAPQAIYKWRRGENLPSVDNLYALSELLDVTMNEILVPVPNCPEHGHEERQEHSCRSVTWVLGGCGFILYTSS